MNHSHSSPYGGTTTTTSSPTDPTTTHLNATEDTKPFLSSSQSNAKYAASYQSSVSSSNYASITSEAAARMIPFDLLSRTTARDVNTTSVEEEAKRHDREAESTEGLPSPVSVEMRSLQNPNIEAPTQVEVDAKSNSNTGIEERSLRSVSSPLTKRGGAGSSYHHRQPHTHHNHRSFGDLFLGHHYHHPHRHHHHPHGSSAQSSAQNSERGDGFVLAEFGATIDVSQSSQSDINTQHLGGLHNSCIDRAFSRSVSSPASTGGEMAQPSYSRNQRQHKRVRLILTDRVIYIRPVLTRKQAGLSMSAWDAMDTAVEMQGRVGRVSETAFEDSSSFGNEDDGTIVIDLATVVRIEKVGAVDQDFCSSSSSNNICGGDEVSVAIIVRVPDESRKQSTESPYKSKPIDPLSANPVQTEMNAKQQQFLSPQAVYRRTLSSPSTDSSFAANSSNFLGNVVETSEEKSSESQEHVGSFKRKEHVQPEQKPPTSPPDIPGETTDQICDENPSDIHNASSAFVAFTEVCIVVSSLEILSNPSTAKDSETTPKIATASSSSPVEGVKNNSFFEAAKRKLGIGVVSNTTTAQSKSQPASRVTSIVSSPSDIEHITVTPAVTPRGQSPSPAHRSLNSPQSNNLAGDGTEPSTITTEHPANRLFELLSSLVRMYDALATAMYTSALQQEKEQRKLHHQQKATLRSGSAGAISSATSRPESQLDSKPAASATAPNSPHQQTGPAQGNGGNNNGRNSRNNRTQQSNTTNTIIDGTNSAPTSPTSSSNHFSATPPSSVEQLRLIEGGLNPILNNSTHGPDNNSTGPANSRNNKSSQGASNGESSSTKKPKTSSQIRRDRQNNNKAGSTSSPRVHSPSATDVGASTRASSGGRTFSNDDITPEGGAAQGNAPSSIHDDWQEVGVTEVRLTRDSGHNKKPLLQEQPQAKKTQSNASKGGPATPQSHVQPSSDADTHSNLTSERPSSGNTNQSGGGLQRRGSQQHLNSGLAKNSTSQQQQPKKSDSVNKRKASSPSKYPAPLPPPPPPPPARSWSTFVTKTSAPDYSSTFIPCNSVECFSDLLCGTEFGLDLVETRVLPENAMTAAQRIEHPHAMTPVELEAYSRISQRSSTASAAPAKDKKGKEKEKPREVSNAILAKKLVPCATLPKGTTLFDLFYHFFDDEHTLFFEYHAARNETELSCQPWRAVVAPASVSDQAPEPPTSNNPSPKSPKETLFGAGQRTFTCKTNVKVVGNTLCVFTEYQRYAFLKVRKDGAPPVDVNGGEEDIRNYKRYLVVQVSGQAKGAMLTDSFRAETLLVFEEKDDIHYDGTSAPTSNGQAGIPHGTSGNGGPRREDVTVTMSTYGSVQFVKSVWGMIKTKILNTALEDEMPAGYRKMILFLKEKMAEVVEADQTWRNEQMRHLLFSSSSAHHFLGPSSLSARPRQDSTSFCDDGNGDEDSAMLLGSSSPPDSFPTFLRQGSTRDLHMQSSGIATPLMSSNNPYTHRKSATPASNHLQSPALTSSAAGASSSAAHHRPPMSPSPATPLPQQNPNPSNASSPSWIDSLKPDALFGSILGFGIGRPPHQTSVAAIPVIGSLALIFSIAALKCFVNVLWLLLFSSSPSLIGNTSDAAAQTQLFIGYFESAFIKPLLVPLLAILLAVCGALAAEYTAAALRLWKGEHH